MHSDSLDDLFANIAPDSPFADEMEALLRDGLAVEPDTLDAATAAVWSRKPRPKRLWWGIGAVGLLAAGSLAFAAVNLLPEDPEPIKDDVTLIEPSAAPLPLDSDPGADPARVGMTGEQGTASQPWSIAELGSQSRDLIDRVASMSHCLHEDNVLEGNMYAEMGLEIAKINEPEMMKDIQPLLERLNASLDKVAQDCEPRGAAASQTSQLDIYQKAFAVYEAGDYPRARELFEEVIEADPGSSAAMQSANLILDTYMKVEDFRGLETAAQRFYEDDELGDESFEAMMLSIAARAAMKQVDEAGGTADEIADGWLDLYDRYGDAHGARARTVEALRAAGRHGEAERLGE